MARAFDRRFEAVPHEGGVVGNEDSLGSGRSGHCGLKVAPAFVADSIRFSL
jgi:hypothetical protein